MRIKYVLGDKVKGSHRHLGLKCKVVPILWSAGRAVSTLMEGTVNITSRMSFISFCLACHIVKEVSRVVKMVNSGKSISRNCKETILWQLEG